MLSTMNFQVFFHFSVLLISTGWCRNYVHASGSKEFDAVEYIHNLDIGKIIIDTDGGCDDAVALLLALNKKLFDILAITTSIGNTYRDQVPVYPGSEASILETPEPDYHFGTDGFGDVPDPNPPNITDARPENAVLKMIEIVNQNPGKITIMAIGPLTNLAMAMRLDSNFKHNIQNIIWMGGSVVNIGNVKPGIEYNAYFDPIANYIVFNSTLTPVIMVTWELVTIKAPTTPQWRREVLGKINSTQVDFLNKIEDYALSTYDKWASADSKAMAIAIDTKLVTNARLFHVEAITEGEHTKGSFIVDNGNLLKRKPNVIVVEGLDVPAYKNLMLEALS